MIAFGAGLCATILALREPMDALTHYGLATAQKRWHNAGVRAYALRYRMHSNQYDVAWRDGVVTEVLVNDQPLERGALKTYGVDGLFDLLESELENLSDPAGPFAGRRESILARVRFNLKLGYVERYVRSSGGIGPGALVVVESFRRLDAP
ncbi:MAG: hypothetical protein IID35_01765 [Planctomycetes bacterium]|nr:hypothetical protein [Planctomycetota bacterium]